jgi:subtilisin-like proprotein convertase family protein
MTAAMVLLALGVFAPPSAALTQSFTNNNDYTYWNSNWIGSREVMSPVTVNVGLSITRIDVALTVWANQNGNDAADLDIYVRHPDGTEQQLMWNNAFNPLGQSIQTTFFDIFKFNGKLSTGQWNLRVRDANNWGVNNNPGGYIDTWTLTIHYQEPSVTLSAPGVAGSIISGNYAMSATVAGAGVDHMQVSVDGAFVSEMTYAAGTYSYTLSTARWPDGPHSVAVTAIDWQGRTDVKSVPVQFDNVRPSIGFVQMVNNAFAKGMQQLLLTGSNGEQSMKVIISLNGPSTTISAQMIALGSNYFGWSWDTTAYPDGTYVIGAATTDSAGNTASAGPFSLTVDNTAPVLAIAGPASGVYVSGSVTLDLAGTADANANFTQYKIDGGPWMPASPGWAQSFQIDTSVLADGQHRLSARVMDLAGLSTEGYVDVVVNNANPVLALVSPSEGDLLQGQSTARAKASAFLPISGVTFRLDGVDRPAGLSGLSGYHEMPIDTAQLGDGEHILSAGASDASGKTVAATGVGFSVDNHPPELGVLWPSEGERVAGEVELGVSASDLYLSGVDWRLDGGPWQPMTLLDQNYTANLSTGGLAEGLHTVNFLAMDAIGHRTPGKVTVNVDNSAPFIQLISPAPNVYLAGMAVFRVRAYDERGLDTVVLHLSGQPNRTLSLNTVTGYHEFEMDTRGLLEGVHSYWAEATDLAGRTVATEPVSFQVDNAAPKLEMRYPVNGMLITGRDGSKTIDANPSDTFMSDVLYNIDGGHWTSPALPFTTGLSDGTHRLTLRAYDIPGRFTEVSVEFRYDATPPVLSVVSPQSEPRMRGVLKVAVSASDHWGIAGVSVAPDASTGAAAKAMAFNPQNGLYEAGFDTAGWLGGDRSATLNVTATDTSGYSASASLGAFVDNSAPVIAKLLPGGPREGTVEFRFNVTDSSALQKVLFRRDGGEWKELTYRESNGAYYTLWKTSLADNGLHVYEVRAVDALGNEKTMSYTVSIENKDYGWVVWVVLVVLAVLIVAYVAYSRRRKPAEDELKADEPEPAPPAPPSVDSPFRAAPDGEAPGAPPATTPPPQAPTERPARNLSGTEELDKIMNDLDK